MSAEKRETFPFHGTEQVFTICRFREEPPLLFPDSEQIQRIRKADPVLLDQLDSMGIFPGAEENPEEFALRVERLRRAYESFAEELDDSSWENSSSAALISSGASTDPVSTVSTNSPSPASPLTPGSSAADVCDKGIFSGARPIPAEILQEAAGKTEALFAFSIDWVPAFFLSRGLGLLWGGCTLVDENAVSVFVIRKNFAVKRRWFIYDRAELLAHEICHVARAPLEDDSFEELFAYMTSSSPFRKYAGNCFQKDRDAVLFLLPVLLLLGVQTAVFLFGVSLPVLPFWILIFLWPLYLFLRNLRSRRTYFQACRALEENGVSVPAAVLFRSTAEEIMQIASYCSHSQDLPDWMARSAENKLRWQIILRKFINHEETSEKE